MSPEFKTQACWFAQQLRPRWSAYLFRVALVGVSGSGKSTMATLIARLHDAKHGAVCLDGIDIRSVKLESIRAKVCDLMQDAVLFDRTLKENLLLGKPSATDEELVRAIAIADLEQLLQRLSSGWTCHSGPEVMPYRAGSVSASRWLGPFSSSRQFSYSLNRLRPSMHRASKGSSPIYASISALRPPSSFPIESQRSNGPTES